MIIDITRNAITYACSQQDLVLANFLAVQSQQIYESKVQNRKSPYQQNNLRSHLVGKIGEICAGNLFIEMNRNMKWGASIEQSYLDPNKDASCDIIINDIRIEIKTWRPSDWFKYGPCISERQAIKLHNKADIIVYGVYDKFKSTFSLVGWNTINDIASVKAQYTGTPGREVLNRVMKERCITDLKLSIQDYA